MKIVNKNVLNSMLLVGLTTSIGAYAAAPATVTWYGEVPVTGNDNELVITGLNGVQEAQIGGITADSMGVFSSDALILEAHVNEGDLDTPIVGELSNANWSYHDSKVTYDGLEHASSQVSVFVNGEAFSPESDPVQAQTVSIKISQTAQLPVADIGGSIVQASVTLMAEKA
ncbi:hypothetical protein [Vibrio genomosp. F10]|uniref:Fimbrial protein n=2 Tax=Vibrio genomosp. F10 TaxID=723171 RepID=A0A1E5BDQ1_9VIBR|nr:hypothetical protein [Vibrio genomosp. F10]OEE33269.1 hypothetical protein A1QO_09965 [Vibrio genomosp. F10 str. ZF-129]OEF08569.1 hypothetical protein A1QI_16215 [Vibrio genomosp. F10 str. 9ZB36]